MPQLTLCIIRQDDKILLGMKKRGFGIGKWNGFGGHIEAGETPQVAAVRELKEECGLEVQDISHTGTLTLEYPDVHEPYVVQVFYTRHFSGTPVETEEMTPRWFALDEIPYEHMWPDDRHWLPLLLSGRRFEGTFIFTPAHELHSWNIKTIS